MASIDEKFLTAKQSADLLGVTLPTIHDWVKRGTLRAWRTQGGHRRIAQSSIDAILRQRERELQGLQKETTLELLVVEDDPIMVTFYQSMLGSWNFPISLVACSNGFEALISIGQKKPDAIIADLAMPHMNGFEMIRTLRERKDLHGVLIIVVTALGNDDIAHHGGLLDKILVFKKPPPLQQLEALLRAKADSLQVATPSNTP
ncbi:MAG: response regulator [Magnetococcales bacterium]|nr:response regulator [Magnetococcales bacterium]